MTDILLGGLLVIVGVVVGTLRSGLTGYATRKGENLATREDLNAVTRRIEALQSEFAAAVQRVAASHSHRFELEVSIYRDLWKAALNLKEAADGIWYEGMARGAQINAYDQFSKELTRFQAAIREASPFFPKQIRGALIAAQLPVRKVAAELASLDFRATEMVREYLEVNLPTIWHGIDELEDAIRDRLEAADTELSRMVGPHS